MTTAVRVSSRGRRLSEGEAGHAALTTVSLSPTLSLGSGPARALSEDYSWK